MTSVVIKIPGRQGPAFGNLSEFGRTLIDDADDAAARTTLDAAQSTWTHPVSGAVARTVHEKLGDLLTAEDLGIVGDGVVEEKVISITSGSPALTVTGGAFTADDVGKLILVYGAGAAGAPLASTISGYTSSTQITLADNAATTVAATSKQIAYGTDDAAAINAAMSAQVGPVRFNPGVYIVSSEVAINDHSGIVGTSAHWKRRKVQHRYDKDASTVFKYIGAGGSNTCVVRASNMAVGVEIATLNDDLLNYALRDFHVDASNLAEFGLYSYRAGNCASQGNITAECAKIANIVHLGQYAAEFGAFGAYESENMGVACGIDLFSWGSVENTNFAFKAYYHTCNNGTAANFVEGSGTDQDCSGGKFSAGRGSDIEIVSEGNYGRAAILSQSTVTGGAAGTTVYRLKYIEANGAGCRIQYQTGYDGITIRDGFIHPGNGSTLVSQNFLIDAQTDAGVTTANAGPTSQKQWLVFDNLQGDLSGVGFDINSNTYKYIVRNCAPGITYSATAPRYRELIPVGTGSAAAPAYSTDGDEDTGMYFPATNTWGVTTGGTQRLSISTTQFSSTLYGRFVAPSDYWSSTGGYYNVGAGNGGLSSEGGNGVFLSVNGYRNNAGTWTSYVAGGATGAAQIKLDPSGFISFGAETSKASGSAISVTETVRIAQAGLAIGATAFGTSAANVLAMLNGTAPSTSPANTGQLYVESGALKYRGAGGTVTTIAPT